VVERNTTPVSAIAAATRVDGRTAAASTARRHRTILVNAMDFAHKLNAIDTNLIRALKWKAPRTSDAVDKRCVVNPYQARELCSYSSSVRGLLPHG
jgi:hypothetical protein